MTMNSTSFFTSRFFAAVCALLLSTTMVLSSVGPAYNVQADTAQSYIA
ncbi:MAG: hypothetical protein J7494_00955 [Sphingobium sp.]|nr:hypothetical protein [Sphingobium sp.]